MFGKKKDVMYFLSENKVKLVTIISVTSSKKGNFSVVTTLGGSLFFWRKGVASFHIC